MTKRSWHILIGIICVTCIVVASIFNRHAPRADVLRDMPDESPMVLIKADGAESITEPLVSSPAFLPQGFLAIFTDHTAGSKRLPHDIINLLPSVSGPDEFQIVENVLLDPSDNEAVRNEAANLLRRSQYSGLPKALMLIIDRSDETPRFRSFAVQHLGVLFTEGPVEERFRYRDRLRDALLDRDREVRREALLALSNSNEISALNLIQDGLNDQLWVADRDLIIRLIGKSKNNKQIDAVRTFIHDPDDSIAIAAIYVLGEWRDDRSLNEISILSHSSNLQKSDAAKIAVRKITLGR